jgi:hypothetical protein
MTEGSIIFAASHVLIAACCVWMIGMLAYMLVKRPTMFQVPWAMLPVIAWLATKGIAQASYVVLMFLKQGHTTVIMIVALNAVAAFIACLTVHFVFLRVAKQPTILEQKQVIEGLAKTLHEVTTEKEPR